MERKKGGRGATQSHFSFSKPLSDHSHQWICVYSTSNLIYNAVDRLHVEGAANDKNKMFYYTYSKKYLIYVCVYFLYMPAVVVRPSLTLSHQINCSVGS